MENIGINSFKSSKLSNVPQAAFKGNEFNNVNLGIVYPDRLILINTLPKEEKNNILHKSKVTASGWSIFFNPLSTIYFALRSDNTIANKYNLDAERDKDFIKQIRREQILAAGVGLLPIASILPWLYFKFVEDPQNQKI